MIPSGCAAGLDIALLDRAARMPAYTWHNLILAKTRAAARARFAAQFTCRNPIPFV